MNLRQLGTLALCLASLALPCCKAGKTNRLETGARLSFSPPHGGAEDARRDDWKEIPQSDGKRWAQARSGMDDLIQFFGFESPCDPAVKSLADLEAVLRNNPAMRFERLEMDTVLGVQVLRYETVQPDRSNHESIRRVLGTTSRGQMEDYQIRTVGAFLFRPSTPPKFVSLGCSRSTSHGELGTYYEGLVEDYLQGFVAENAAGWEAPQP